MSNQTSNRSRFWRAKYARECTKSFQVQQILPYIIEVPRGPGSVIPSDRPPLKPIRSPIPILTSRSGTDGAPGEAPKDLLVGIVGAGPAGLYTAMILDDLGIKYEILEGSDRLGGRIRTHHFRSVDVKPWNYFDIGAMRYPDIPIMWRVFDLFRERLQIEDKLIPYIMNNGNQFLEYNSQRVQQKTVISDPTADWFKDCSSAGGLVPPEFINKGVDHWLSECFTPFKKLLAENWEKGCKKLMDFDQYSARTFMMLPFCIKNEDGTCFLKKEAYPNSVINWMERMNTGTGMFDTAFSEMVIDDLQFDWPTGSAMAFGGDGEEESDVSWRCLAGGSEVFIDAMVSKISVPTPKIQYNKRVTSITPTATGTKPLSVTYGSEASNEYDYVISTIPLPALRFVDLDGCNLSYAQLEGLRTLRYDSSCKVGIRFSSRWWQTLPTGSIKGGQTKTDRVVRTVVFPSYGVNDLNADAVMIASYTWSQDAARVGGLINGRHTADEQFLIDNILKDLAALHDVTFDFLKKELRDWCAWEWYSDPFTLGAFALFGPGQFSSIYPAFGQGAAGGRLLFAGEALSDQHA
ncbi:FAD/NAD(P)-binding domain-containing protein [Armillaria solidipes]|uniref:FAD/NAD(P)-binding domain-containing protein n=1 Tax=Armillaria solidipes TaxID=1076256 RepID=A0A2H3BXA9_9AGAR|nr:FAD/NAD(P)-binding domain-containing protein [Armillaria solidipes]